jgi:outer membrane protein OmpA-like peptidoglycan-associated protein
MKLNQVLRTMLMGMALLPLAPLALHAQDAGVVKSIKIVEALSSKDIVLDRPGRPMSIDLQVQFDFNSADLLPQGRRQLDELALALGDQALVAEGFEVIGHTDRVGNFEYNVQLSMARAAAVQDYLITRHAISPARLMTMGLGFSRLADPANPTAAINRRVEIRRVAALTRPANPPANPPVNPLPAPGGRLVATPQ